MQISNIFSFPLIRSRSICVSIRRYIDEKHAIRADFKLSCLDEWQLIGIATFALNGEQIAFPSIFYRNIDYFFIITRGVF